MDPVREYILNELEVIKGECREKSISPAEWVQRYAKKYSREHWDGSWDEGCVGEGKGEVRL